MATEQFTKQCRICNAEKPRSEYWKNNSAPDGLDYRCKPCVRAAIRKHRNSEEWRQKRAEYQAKWSKTTKGRACSNRHRDRHREQHPYHHKAHLAVQVAIQNGTISQIAKQACADCGVRAEHYHHESYSPDQWLVVVPLCRKCHYVRHGWKARTI